ncbi:MAG: histidine kinase [Eubacterium sp.]|nr:histidine kinase [Eubacterium sp.]
MGTNPYYSSFELWGGVYLLLAALILWFSGKKKSTGRAAVLPVLATGVMLIADSFSYQFRGVSGDVAYVVVRISNFISIFSSCWITGLFFPYLYRSIPEEKREKYKEWWMPAVLLICGSESVLLIVSQFTGILYTIDEENLYHRGSFMGLAMVLQLLLLVTYLSLSVREKLLIPALITGGNLIALVIQIFLYGFPTLHIVCGIASLTLFVWELIQETKKSKGKEAQIIENEETIGELQTRIALSQIKPHFLYNALNSVYVLCGRDVNEARNAISLLSDYLRSNMSSIDSKLPVPFSKEIEMVENYLAIEKIRFPEELNYSIVTPVTNFSLPALTIQPLVENAVRHGIKPLDEDGIITITTRETDQAYIVSIMDNGVGFDVNSSDHQGGTSEHIGIRNVRERLKRLSSGELVIRSEPGLGTEAVIRIPK